MLVQKEGDYSVSDKFGSIFSPLSHSLNESSMTSGAQFEAMTDLFPLGRLRWHQQERKYRKAQWIVSLPSSFYSLSLALAITRRYSRIKMDFILKKKLLSKIVWSLSNFPSSRVFISPSPSSCSSVPFPPFFPLFGGSTHSRERS